MTYYNRRIAPSEIGLLPIQPPVCDFCGLHAPEFIYAAMRASDGTPGFVWRWCACHSCNNLIQLGAWPEIIENIAQTVRRSTEQPLLICRIAATTSLREFHRYVWAAGTPTE